MTTGISMPSVRGQEDVIRKAYDAARLQTDKTVYVEVYQCDRIRKSLLIANH
jgi:acyl transferase domain-containing protein